jgi:dipeptidyl aminopeptidase/acylaminoacyl peptidase
MSEQFRISDAQLEQLLHSRAAMPDPQLLGDIVALTEQRRQRRGLFAGLVPAQRPLLLLATVALLLAALAGAIAVGAGLIFPNPLDLGERDSLIISRDECGLIGVDPTTGEQLSLWQPDDPCEPSPRRAVPTLSDPLRIDQLGIAAAGSQNGRLAFVVSAGEPGWDSALVGLWTLDLATGRAQRIGDCEVEICLFVDISPDGDRIAHAGWDGTAEGARRLTITDARGRLIASLELEAAAIEPRFSPNGSRILFTGSADGALHLVGADGSGLTSISYPEWFVRSASWSPDGQRLAFAAVHRQTDEYGIWLADSHGGNPRQLASLDGGQTERHWPAWSPDGEWIAYARRTDHRTRGSFEVWVIRDDGSDARQVYEDCCEPNTVGSVPAWSPDGERIAFAASRPDPRHTDGRIEAPGLYVGRRDGSDLRRVGDLSIAPFIWQRLP